MAKQKDGRYRTKVTVGHDADGTPVVRYVSGKTKKELEDNKQELIRTYIGGAKVDRDTLFGEYAEQWVNTYKIGKMSAGTDENYRTTLYKHLLPVFGDRRLAAISALDLQAHLDTYEGASKTTVSYIKSVMKNVFASAYANGIIDRDPSTALVLPSCSHNTRRALTEAETNATVKVGGEHPDGLILLVFFYTGLRRGEAVGLQWRDIDFKKRRITVTKDFDFKRNQIGTPKTASSSRQVPMPDALADALDAHRGFGDTFVFGEYMNLTEYMNMWKRIQRALYECDNTIEEGKKGRSVLTAHYYRHNYASILYNADVDILTARNWLGHRDIKTTLNIYSHLQKEKELQNANTINDVFRKLPKSCQFVPYQK